MRKSHTGIRPVLWTAKMIVGLSRVISGSHQHQMSVSLLHTVSSKPNQVHCCIALITIQSRNIHAILPSCLHIFNYPPFLLPSDNSYLNSIIQSFKPIFHPISTAYRDFMGKSTFITLQQQHTTPQVTFAALVDFADSLLRPGELVSLSIRPAGPRQ